MVSIFDFGDGFMQNLNEDQKRQLVSQGLLDFGAAMLEGSQARGRQPSFGEGLGAGASALSQSLREGQQGMLQNQYMGARTKAAEAEMEQAERERQQAEQQRQMREGLFAGLAEKGEITPEQTALMMTYPEMGEEYLQTQYLPGGGDPTSVQRDAQFLFPDDPQKQRDYVNQVTTQSKAPNVSVSLPPQQSEYAKKRGGFYAESANEIEQEAQRAQEQLNQVNALRNIISDPNVYTGAGGGAVANLKRFGSTMLGMDLEGVGGAEAAEAIGNQLVISMASDLPGQLSDRDMRVLQSIPPGISRSAEGNELIADYFERVNRRKLEAAQMAREYEQQHGQIDAGFTQRLAEYNRENPLFTQEDVRRMQQAAEQVQQPAPGAGAEPEIDALLKKYGAD